jgi:hypothetical protein
MASWSSRRKSFIGWTLFLIILAIVAGGYFFFFYKAPTCFDGIKNGGELDVDCGGKCVKLCQSAYLPATIAWGGGKAEKVAEGSYNVAAYIINPNTDGAATGVPYKFTLYDSRGILITERKGKIDIPAHRNTLVFESSVKVGERVPAKVTFEFTSAPVWFKSLDTLSSLAVVDKKYTEDETSSSLQVTLENKGLTAIDSIVVGAVLYDIDGNAIGFSRTLIDSLPPKGREIAPFTWPVSRQGKVVTVEALPVVQPVRK